MSRPTDPASLGYPPEITEFEQVEIASALSYHFDQCATTDDERKLQYDIVCGVVNRMMRRRAGLVKP